MKVLIGRKVGMTQIYTEDGTKQPVTVVDISGVKVAKQLSLNGKVSHVELGKGQRKKANQPDNGNYKQLGSVPAFKTTIKLTDTDEVMEVGTELGANIFAVGDKVDVRGTTKGKGFQGVVKRWGFHGGPATHGQSDKHRGPGAISSGTNLGRVIKGLRMSGHMGNVERTIQNLKIVEIMEADGLIAIAGSIPGNKGDYLIITPSVKARGK
jgi:large subunit ribosomal protein L3